MLRRMAGLLGATLFMCGALGEISPFARLLAYFCSVAYTANGSRGTGAYVLGLNGHDYAPSVMKDGSTYKIWWCANNNNSEDIMYAEATNLDGPWSTPISVLQPTGTSTFDSGVVCDPSVIRVGGTYYLYYGGAENVPGTITRMGVASSPNGINWTRLNGGQPIVTPARGPGHPQFAGFLQG